MGADAIGADTAKKRSGKAAYASVIAACGKVAARHPRQRAHYRRTIMRSEARRLDQPEAPAGSSSAATSPTGSGKANRR